MTPGPWIVQFPLPGIDGMPITILGPDGKRLVARVFSGEADAKLIQAAPEMVEILKRIGAGSTMQMAVDVILRRIREQP